MAYIRKRGKQLALVHGRRDPETRKVQQEILLTLYSRDEARAALDLDQPEGGRMLESLLTYRYPDLRLDWGKIRAEIEAEIEHLPEDYDHRAVRLTQRFRQDLVAFARQLMLGDPQASRPAGELIEEHRAELACLADLIRWRLELGARDEHQFNRDNRYYWRFSLPGRGLPPETLEYGAGLLERGELEQAEGAFRLATACFPEDPLGWRYSGIVALRRGDVASAAERLEEAVTRARAELPKRLPTKAPRYREEWRSYERSACVLVDAYTRAGRDDDAVALCDRLEAEGAEPSTVAYLRAYVHLEGRRWPSALEAADACRGLWPLMSLVAGLAAAELGRDGAATERLLHAVLNLPRATAMVAGERTTSEPEPWEVHDHNQAVEFFDAAPGYSERRSSKGLRALRALRRDPRVRELIDEVRAATRQWSDRRQPSDTSKSFERMREMQAIAFADEQAAALGGSAVRERRPKAKRKRSARRPEPDAPPTVH